MEIAVNAWSLFATALLFYIPLRIYFISRSFITLVVAAWLTIFVWAVFLWLILPDTMAFLGGTDAYDYCPDGPVVIGSAFGGWIFGLELALLVQIGRGVKWLIRKIQRLIKPQGN